MGAQAGPDLFTVKETTNPTIGAGQVSIGNGFDSYAYEDGWGNQRMGDTMGLFPDGGPRLRVGAGSAVELHGEWWVVQDVDLLSGEPGTVTIRRPRKVSNPQELHAAAEDQIPGELFLVEGTWARKEFTNKAGKRDPRQDSFVVRLNGRAGAEELHLSSTGALRIYGEGVPRAATGLLAQEYELFKQNVLGAANDGEPVRLLARIHDGSTEEREQQRRDVLWLEQVRLLPSAAAPMDEATPAPAPPAAADK